MKCIIALFKIDYRQEVGEHILNVNTLERQSCRTSFIPGIVKDIYSPESLRTSRILLHLRASTISKRQNVHGREGQIQLIINYANNRKIDYKQVKGKSVGSESSFNQSVVFAIISVQVTLNNICFCFLHFRVSQTAHFQHVN